MSDPDDEPFRRVKKVSMVQNDVRQMQGNLRDLQSELRQLEWRLLGGRGMYDPEKAQRLCKVTSDTLDYLEDVIADLPARPEEVSADE